MRNLQIWRGSALGLAAWLFVGPVVSWPVAAEPAAAKSVAAEAGQVGTVQVDACASDPKRLGLSRIVEVDTTGGPQFGGSHGAETAFLKDGEVILTFDDGPLRAYTRSVLKALAAHCTKATFFIVGRMAVADPAMVKEVSAAGHTIGSHTWSHQNLTAIGALKGRQELESGVSAVTKARGAPIAPFFRFPFLSGSRVVEDYAKTRNISAIWIDVDSKDYQTRDPKTVHERIMGLLKVQRKGIILMHDIQPSTAKAIMGLLDDLRDKGFKVVHLVPKSNVDTIAAFDGAAEKAVAAKAAAARADPLASRSMVWTMAPAAAVSAGAAAAGAARASEAAAGVARAVKPRARTARKTAAAQADEALPWSPPDVKKNTDEAPASAKAKKVPRAKTEELPWQFNILKY